MRAFEYTGKTVLVTGASMGIGEAFARQISARGATVVLVARSEAKLAALADALGGPAKAHLIAMDLGKPGAAQRVYDAVRSKGLTIDVLVNNAGFGTHGPFREIPLTTLTDEIDLNVRALVELTHLFLPEIERRQGGVIHVASVAGYQPIPYMAVYAATKAFVIAFGEALWAEVRSRGVRVTVVSPGATETAFFERSGTDAAAGIENKARPEDVARVGLAAFDRGRASIVHGTQNHLMTLLSRLFTRQSVVALGARFTKPTSKALPA